MPVRVCPYYRFIHMQTRNAQAKIRTEDRSEFQTLIKTNLCLSNQTSFGSIQLYVFKAPTQAKKILHIYNQVFDQLDLSV